MGEGSGLRLLPYVLTLPESPAGSAWIGMSRRPYDNRRYIRAGSARLRRETGTGCERFAGATEASDRHPDIASGTEHREQMAKLTSLTDLQSLLSESDRAAMASEEQARPATKTGYDGRPQKLDVRLDTKRRRGKTVTLITGFQSSPAELQRIADDLKRNNGFIPGVKPGQPTVDYIGAVMDKITLPGAILLAVVGILPGFAQRLGVQPSFSSFLRRLRSFSSGLVTLSLFASFNDSL